MTDTTPNKALERTTGSHSLAAAAHRRRSTDPHFSGCGLTAIGSATEAHD